MKQLFLFALLLLALPGRAQDFAARTPLPAIGRGEPFTFAIDGSVYLGSGGYENDFYRYDPGNGNWTPLGTIPGVTTARGFSVAFVIDGKAYVCLGRDGTTLKNDLWQYDPATGEWHQKHDFPGAARMGAFGFALNGKGYVGGGTDLTYLYGDFYSYDPVQDEWAPLGASPLGPTVFSSAFAVDGYGYCLGGGLATGAEGAQLFRFDPANQQWTPRASFIGTPREAAACFVLGDQVYYGTGQSQFAAAFNDFFVYDPAGNAWSPANAFPGTARGWTGACSTGDKAYIGLGWDLGNTLFNDWWEISLPTGIAASSAPVQVDLYPDPATDLVNVRFVGSGPTSLRVRDSAGRLVASGTAVAGVGTLDVSMLSPGTYILEVAMSPSAVQHQRFIKR